MKYSFDQSVIVAVLMAFLLMSLACLSLIGIGNMVETAHRVEHAQIVIHRLQTLLTEVQEGTIAARSFLLTGNPAYWQSFQKSSQDVPAQLQALKGLTPDNPARQSDLAQLQELLNQHLASLKRFGQSGNVQLRFVAQQFEEDNKRLAEIKDRITAMQAEESALLQQHAAKAQQNSTVLKSIIILGSLIGLVALLGSTLSLWHEMTMRTRVEETLRQSEERERLMIEGVKDYAISVLDTGGRVASWNLGAEHIKGYRAEEIIGQHFSRFYPEDKIRQGIPDKELRVAADKGRSEDEGWRVRKDGSRFWASVIINAVRDAQGELLGFVKITRDLTERKQIEETLRQNEERMRLMMESIKDCAIFMLDPRGRVVSWNPGAERIKGYRAEEIIGQHFSRFYPEDKIREGSPEKELRVAAEKGRFEDEGWRLRKDGSRFWADVIINAARNAQGELLGFVKLARDMTERRRGEQALLERQQMFEGLFENSPDAIILVDQAGRIVRTNARIEALFGYTRAELEDRSVETLMPERYRARHGKDLAGYFAAPRTRAMGAGLELFARRKDGSEFPVDIMLSPLETGEGGHALAVIRDITVRKEAEGRIQKLNKELKQRADMLETANKELEAFSYSVSHDLRAPLRHIHGFVELLQKSPALQGDESSRRQMSVISTAAKEMGRLIDDLLAFSRTGRAEMHPIKINMREMVDQVIRDREMECQERKVRWKIKPLSGVTGDPNLLRLVWINLLDNALKYTRPRQEAKIEIGQTVREGPDAGGRELVFYVRDNGVGFDMRYAAKLFGVFQRLHRAEDFEGTGIGLANVQRIVHRHGGRVWAEGQVDSGATFYFSLPATTTQPG